MYTFIPKYAELLNETNKQETPIPNEQETDVSNRNLLKLVERFDRECDSVLFNFWKH